MRHLNPLGSSSRSFDQRRASSPSQANHSGRDVGRIGSTPLQRTRGRPMLAFRLPGIARTYRKKDPHDHV